MNDLALFVLYIETNKKIQLKRKKELINFAHMARRNFGGFIPSDQLPVPLTKTQMGAVLWYTGGESLWLNKYLNRWPEIDGGLASIEEGVTKEEQLKLKRSVQLVSASKTYQPNG
jgi:hypothetical protein